MAQLKTGGYGVIISGMKSRMSAPDAVDGCAYIRFALLEQFACLLFGDIEVGLCGQAAGYCRHNFPSFNMPSPHSGKKLS
jgi:hypothetical protein